MTMSFVIAPGRKTYECWHQKENKQLILDWLSANGPDEWHVLADRFNWDSGHDVLGVISEQPECDRATAQLIFMRTDPSYYLSSQDAYARGQKPGCAFQLALDIVDRWKRAFYVRAEIGFSDENVMDWARVAFDYQRLLIERWNRDAKLMLPKDFLEPPTGNVLKRDQYPILNRLPIS
jgi:hypothetical protein